MIVHGPAPPIHPQINQGTLLVSIRIALCFVLSIFASAPAWAEDLAPGPLAAYVARPDDSFGWSIRRTGQLGSAEYAELTFTSQTWREIVWKHQLFVLKPPTVDDSRQGLLMIAGGRWRPELEGPADETDRIPGEAHALAAIAAAIQAPVAVLLHVPHQPIFDGLTEDAAIAYTFEQYYRTGDPEWPLLLPMVKSAVRAMDAVEQFADRQWQLPLERFTVTGASKRGWTTWLTGAVDPRATALAPMVIDVLNMGPQMEHQKLSFGGFSEEIEDYTRLGLQDQIDTDAGRALNAIVDPYSYRAQLTQPKMILLGTNDRYWPLDALNIYWDGLEGEKHVSYVPNNGHGLKDLPRVAGAVAALHLQAAGKLTLPKMTWQLDESAVGLKLVLSSDPPPERAAVWRSSAATRDFRDSAWESASIDAGESGYAAELARPSDGFAAMFGEAQFDAGGLPYYLSTNVRILGAERDVGE
jgi:PhoPQ-activated pathogenicity-related protein